MNAGCKVVPGIEASTVTNIHIHINTNIHIHTNIRMNIEVICLMSDVRMECNLKKAMVGCGGVH